MAITTVEAVKRIIKASDEQIIALIPLVEDWIKGYCNNSYENGFPPGYELIAIKMIQYNVENKAGLTNESLSRYSVGFLDDYPKSITKGLKRRLVW